MMKVIVYGSIRGGHRYTGMRSVVGPATSQHDAKPWPRRFAQECVHVPVYVQAACGGCNERQRQCQQVATLGPETLDTFRVTRSCCEPPFPCTNMFSASTQAIVTPLEKASTQQVGPALVDVQTAVQTAAAVHALLSPAHLL
jgi:hypothetical protein